MKKINAKQLLAVSVIGLALASCGGGGGGKHHAKRNGGSGSGNGGTPPATPISMNIYAGTDYPNEPIVVVYINGKPVKMLLDTGASGVLVNQGAVHLSQTAYTSQTFSVTYGSGRIASGTDAIATVCPTSSTIGCVTMPIAVNSYTSGTKANFLPNEERQGDFGMKCGNNTQGGPNAFCYLYYLWRENPSYSSYSLSFNIPSNNFYYVPSTTTPIGTITYGSFSANNLINYSNLKANAVYGNSLTVLTSFDTGTNAVVLPPFVLQSEIPNFSSSSDENACGMPNEVQGGFNLYYQIPYANSTSMFSTTFTTEPTSNMCSVFSNNPVIVEGLTRITGKRGYVIIGLPEMIRHSYIWILGNNGMVQYISIQ